MMLPSSESSTDNAAARAGALTRRALHVTSQFENNCFTEMCSGSEAGSYSRRIDCAPLNSKLETKFFLLEQKGNALKV